MAVNPNLTIRYAEVDLAYEQALASAADEDGPVWMVNLMRYRPVAEYADGRASTMSGQEADDAYAPFDAFAEVGAELVFLAEVESQLLGEPPAWDRVAVVRYPTHRAFVEMTHLPSFEEKHPHKDAGMARTIVVGGVPRPTPTLPADAPAWADVPHPPTDDDPPIVVFHLLRFAERPDATEAMVSYQDAAGAVAVPHGVRIGGWLTVEGTILGDGRDWDEARFNRFPSRNAFFTVALDPDRLAAQAEHREPALADTYALVLRPVLDRLTASLAGG